MSRSPAPPTSPLAARLPTQEPYNFSWVLPGELCASAYPEREPHMRFLLSNGVGHVVCLAEERRPPPLAGVSVHVIPVEEFEAPELPQVLQFIGICETARVEGKAVHVHCRMGRGRTGVMLACYLVRFKGLVPQAAVCTVRYNRPYSVETWEQEYVVRDYHDYLARNRD